MPTNLFIGDKMLSEAVWLGKHRLKKGHDKRSPGGIPPAAQAAKASRPFRKNRFPSELGLQGRAKETVIVFDTSVLSHVSRRKAN
jgi:hypothetical protein